MDLADQQPIVLGQSAYTGKGERGEDDNKCGQGETDWSDAIEVTQLKIIIMKRI